MPSPDGHHPELAPWHGWAGTFTGMVLITVAAPPLAALTAWALARRSGPTPQRPRRRGASIRPVSPVSPAGRPLSGRPHRRPARAAPGPEGSRRIPGDTRDGLRHGLGQAAGIDEEDAPGVLPPAIVVRFPSRHRGEHGPAQPDEFGDVVPRRASRLRHVGVLSRVRTVVARSGDGRGPVWRAPPQGRKHRPTRRNEPPPF